MYTLLLSVFLNIMDKNYKKVTNIQGCAKMKQHYSVVQVKGKSYEIYRSVLPHTAVLFSRGAASPFFAVSHSFQHLWNGSSFMCVEKQSFKTGTGA